MIIKFERIIFGFSLVEILVSISLFLIFVTTVSNMISYSFKQQIYSTNIMKALILADESLEIVKNIRDNDFSNLTNGIYGLSSNADHWAFTESVDVSGIFERQIEISDFNDGQKIINITINWDDEISDTNSFSASTFLTDWRGVLDL